MNHPSVQAPVAPTRWWRLSAMALPLAFVTLPLYVMLPHRYAQEWQVPLASLGMVLLGVRTLDAVSDPWLGQLCDRWFTQGPARVLFTVAWLSLLLSAGFAALWLPHLVLQALALPVDATHVLVLASVCLVITYLAATSLNLCHQSWGTRLGGDVAQQSRIVAWREGFALSGVVMASVLPSVVGPEVLVICLAVFLWLGCAGWRGALAPSQARPVDTHTDAVSTVRLLLQRPAFRALLSVFMLNGIASAVPATLVMFFIQDRIQAPAGHEAYFLGLYFLAAALSFAFWLACVQRIGLIRTWGLGMAWSVAVFVWALSLSAGDVWAYGLLCAASGWGLGADLVVPGALLTGVIQRSGDAQHSEGRYLGWWQVATKLNLALAAGVTLPLLSWLGYSVGTRDASGLLALSWIYAGLPCVLKLLAAWHLYRTHHLIQPQGVTS